MKRRTLLLGSLVLPAAARADTWPSKPIRLIVPLAPGATADIVARIFADELSKALGQNVVVDNKTGAGGTIATAEAARAAPDGYTIALVSQGTHGVQHRALQEPGLRSAEELHDRWRSAAASPTS